MSILPIVTFDDEILRERTEPVKEDSNELQTLIDDMFETMYNGNGVGLAAPQIGRSIRLFVVDADAMYEQDDTSPRYGKQVFINPELIEKDDNNIPFDEGCLSIPGVRESVMRPDKITVKYLDRTFKEQNAEFDGWMSRVFQHELDHLNGVLFIDYLGSFKRRLLKTRLNKVIEGSAEVDYPVKSKH